MATRMGEMRSRGSGLPPKPNRWEGDLQTTLQGRSSFHLQDAFAAACLDAWLIETRCSKDLPENFIVELD